MRPRLIKLTPEYNIKPFDCEDADLNGFLLETDHTIPNARHHAIELLAVTYLIEDIDEDETIAYFSLLNDKIEREITDTTAWNRLSRQLPNIKRRSSHPSVKVGRLAVSKKYQGQKWGEQILSLLKEWFTHDNHLPRIPYRSGVREYKNPQQLPGIPTMNVLDLIEYKLYN